LRSGPASAEDKSHAISEALGHRVVGVEGIPARVTLLFCGPRTSARVKLVDVDADKRGEGQPAWCDAPTRGNEQSVDPGVIEAVVLGPAEGPEEDLGGVVEPLQDGLGVEVEGLAAAVGGDAVGEVDAQPPAGQLADGDVGVGEEERRGDVPPEGVAGEVDDVVGSPPRAPGHPGRPGNARIERADPMQLDMRAPRIDGRRELTKN